MSKHVNFYENQYLRAPDMQAEQSYHIDMHRRHNAKLHTSGVVEGLIITKNSATEIKISAGMAIDKMGREIVLETEQTRTISGAGPRYITIAYKEELTDDPEEGFNVTGNDKIRVTESWEIAEIGTAADITDAHVILGVVIMEGGIIKWINDGTLPNHRRISGAAGGLAIRDASGGYTANISVPSGASDLRIRVGDASNDPQTLPERLTITKDGNVGIGATNPKARLHVTGDAPLNANNGQLLITETGGNSMLLGRANSYGFVQSHNKEPLALNPLGNNVGIGTENPQAKLHVAGGLKLEIGEGLEFLGDNDYFGTNLDARVFRMIDTNRKLGVVDGGIAIEGFTTSDNIRKPIMAIRGDGNVGIGTKEPDTKLKVMDGDVEIEKNGSPKLSIYSRGNGTQKYSIRVTNDQDETGGRKLIIRNESIERDHFRIDPDGRVFVNNVQVTSDVRLKHDIETLEGSLAKLTSIRGVAYKRKDIEQDNHANEFGLIAQEVEKVFPELVTSGLNGMKSLNYNGLIPVLVEAIKEQQRLISQLANK